MPEIKLGVGLYSCPTANHQRQSVAGGVRYAKDDAAIDLIIKDLDTQLKSLDNHIVEAKIPKFGVRGIFVAPEYLFAYSDGVADRRGIADFAKERIIAKLKALSKKYDGIIIIPGSIAWETGILGSGVANISMGGKLGTSGVGKPIPIMEAKEHWANSEVKKKVGGGTSGDTGPEKISKFGQKKLAKAQGKVKLQKNTVVLLHNGKVLNEYSKASDYKESRVEDRLHVPEPYPGLFKVKTHKGELTIGIEVCLDHAYNTLGHWITTTGKQSPHLHVVCSAEVALNKVWVRPGGSFLHASSNPMLTQILDENKNVLSAGLKKAELTMPGLLCWTITVQI